MTERAYGGCGKYIQKAGEIDRVGTHLAAAGGSVMVLIDAFIEERYGNRLKASFDAAGLTVRMERFGGECWQGEVDRLVPMAREIGAAIVAGIGGGKTADTAKLVATEIGARIAIVPTIASTDAPCSGLAMRYFEDGSTDRPIFLPNHPDIVIVDPEVIIAAPVRFLVAGIGDALSTYFEARSNADTRSKNYIAGGYRMPLAGMAIARQCHETLMRDARMAVVAAQAGQLTSAVENIVEANTLLSGLGFENCACSAAHGIHNGMTVLHESHQMLHGEKVAFGTLCLLVLEDREEDEIAEAFEFCEDLGLPTTLADLGLGDVSHSDLRRVAEASLNAGEPTHASFADLTPETILASMLTADAMGRARRDAANG